MLHVLRMRRPLQQLLLFMLERELVLPKHVRHAPICPLPEVPFRCPPPVLPGAPLHRVRAHTSGYCLTCLKYVPKMTQICP